MVQIAKDLFTKITCSLLQSDSTFQDNSQLFYVLCSKNFNKQKVKMKLSLNSKQ